MTEKPQSKPQAKQLAPTPTDSGHLMRAGLILAAVLSCGSCASATPVISSPESALPAPSATPAGPSRVVVESDTHLGLELSTGEVQDGTLLVITAHVGAEYGDLSPVGHFSARMIVPGTGEFNDKEVTIPFYPAPAGAEPVSGTVYEGLLAIPYAMPSGSAQVLVTVGSAEHQHTSKGVFSIVPGTYKSETLKVKGKYVSPAPKDLPRIRREQHLIGQVYTEVRREKLWSGPFQLPINSPITSEFGSRRMYNGTLANFHGGLDLKAPTGTRIFAPAPGRVVLAKNLYYTGNTVFLDHGYGLITFYGHMSKLKVKTGQSVKTGRLLGLAGKTGRANGPHLHWQAVAHGVKFNPLDLTRVLR